MTKHQERIERLMGTAAQDYDAGFTPRTRGEDRAQYLAELRRELESMSASEVSKLGAVFR